MKATQRAKSQLRGVLETLRWKHVEERGVRTHRPEAQVGPADHFPEAQAQPSKHQLKADIRRVEAALRARREQR